MKRLSVFVLITMLTAMTASGQKPQHPTSHQPAGTGFSPEELRAFATLEPIDTHTHVFQVAPVFDAMLQKLHMHILDILVVDDHGEPPRTLEPQLDEALEVVHANPGRAALCTTFDPFKFKDPGFSEAAVRQINQNFHEGAIA